MAIKRCKSSFAVVVDGAPRVVTVGTLVKDGDPILKGREAHFEDAETYVSDRAAARVEQATAGPGERRSMSRPAAKKAVPAKKAEPKAESKAESKKDEKEDSQ